MHQEKVVYIYPDVALAVSLLMNFLILWGTAKINKIELRWIRISAGATVGALYSFAAAFPQMSYLHSFWLKVPFSVGMVAVAFMPVNIKRFSAITAIFYIVSFTLGGLFVGILFFLSSSPLYSYLIDLSNLISRYFYPGLALTAGTYVFITKFAGRLLHKRLSQSVFLVPVKVLFDGSEVEVQALIDTGNRLQDPLSETPVVIVEYGALKEIFSIEIRRAFEHSADPDLMLILDSIYQTSWSTRFRVIPFTSLGRENGIIVGFKPDKIEIFNEGEQVSTSNVIIGIYRQELCPDGGYRALLHPDILDVMTA